jgi:DNA-3-methyladenine glycosylase II
MTTSLHPFSSVATAAEAHLKLACPRLSPWVEKIGTCTLEPTTDVFAALMRSVIAQLISSAAAKSISGRLFAALKNRVTPARLLALTDEQMKACGISGGKMTSLRGIARHFADTRGLNRKLLLADDDGVRDVLLPLKGVGPWTVDMLLMFSLGRPDVLPVGDLGIRAAVKDLFRLRQLPDAKKLTKLAAPWRPYRTVACWYLWRTRGWVPQSGEE